MIKKETAKERIIIASRALFSEVGFESTSVREIARRATVNLASINYYFKSKKNLLNEIFLLNCENISEKIEILFHEKEHWKIDEFSVEIFSLLEGRKEELYSTFMIFFNDRVSLLGELDESNRADKNLPGEKYFTQVIDKNFGSNSKEWQKKWLMRTVFNNIIWEVMALQSTFTKKSDSFPLNKEESIKRIRNLCFCLIKGISEGEEGLHEISF
jgi:AcrR family transcriptional regulator